MIKIWIYIHFIVLKILTLNAKCFGKTTDITLLLKSSLPSEPLKQAPIDCPSCSMAVTGGIFPVTLRIPTQQCPRCWCQNSKYYSFNDCNCDCLLTLSNTPNIILTWHQTQTDLDLHVIDPNGEEIYWNHLSSKSGGRLLRDMQSGPNAVEVISWGINSDRKGPNGSYKVYVVAYSLLKVSTSFSVAILESVDQPWWYFNGEVNQYQKHLVYEFTVDSSSSSVTSLIPSVVNLSGVCGMIYGPCDCGFDENCICSCMTT